jgi:dimethylaniline monooxygenase (N-oxide forming)
MSRWFPHLFNWMIDTAINQMSKKAFPSRWNFSPAPSISVTAPLIADEIYPFLQSGFAEPVTEVRRIIGPKSVELTDGTTLTDIDTIIYCTGYDMAVPFVPKMHNPYPVLGEPPMLYRNIFPLNKDPTIRDSLAFLGQAAIPFAGFAQHELIAMAVAQVWGGKTQLPSYEEMQKWRRGYLAWRKDLASRQKVKSTFYVAFMPVHDHMKWLDKVAGTGIFENFGWGWKAWSFWWRDKELYRKCKTGLFSPAIWRLFETGRRKAWPQARQQILDDNVRAERQIKERREMMEEKKKKGKSD